MKTLVPMLTINKLTAALSAIRSTANNSHTTPDANLNLIYVIASETLKETAEEIEIIKREAGPELACEGQGVG
jgi:hypothetical protein